MTSTLTQPDVTADIYEVAGYGFDVAVIKMSGSESGRGRKWATCVTARIPSRSGGHEHHVRIYRKAAPKCSCAAMAHGKLCWATELLALIASDNGFWN